jgi:hypothetical protein
LGVVWRCQAATLTGNRSKEFHLKSFKTTFLAIFLVFAAATTFAQTPPPSRQARQPQQAAQPQQQVIPPGSTPLAMTSEEVNSLSSSFKDGHILLLNQQLVQSQIAPLQAQVEDIRKQQGEWRVQFNNELNAVKLAHKWGPDVVFDNNTLGFVRTPPPAPIVPVAPSGPSGATGAAGAAAKPVSGYTPTAANMAASPTPSATPSATPSTTPSTAPAKK